MCYFICKKLKHLIKICFVENLNNSLSAQILIKFIESSRPAVHYRIQVEKKAMFTKKRKKKLQHLQ